MVITSVVVTSVGNSYAQNSSNLAIYLQIEVRDSNGNLVAYLETDRVLVVDPIRFNKIIDQNIGQFQKSVINIQGQQYEILKATQSIVHQSPTIVSQNLISVNIGKETQLLATADHDGYPVVPGDKVTSHWTIIRLAGS